MANEAESYLENSKDSGRDRVTVFDQSVTWREFEELVKIENTFEKWLDNQWLTKSMLYSLNSFIEMAKAEHLLCGRDYLILTEMECTKWRAMLTYSAERNVASSLKGEERREIVDRVLEQLTYWLTAYGGKLRIPLWKLLYNIR
ncbi:hypothetical protein GF413_00485 [Candidatus Micrarchaeota archaeon]|nr:hypothetical protein [Candidatus Micrarchaeota archaeon]